MRYMGSKARLAKQIVPLLMNGHDQECLYVEPFVGGGNMISKVPARNKWGNDNSFYAVELLRAVAQGWQPPTDMDERTYEILRSRAKAHDAGTDPALIGFAAFCCSYAGKEWGGFWRAKASNGNPRNPAAEQAKNLALQRPGLISVRWTCMDYRLMTIPEGATVYCDPPYAMTTGYRSSFDHEEFWGWAEALATRGCRVFVSEFEAPNGWEAVWEKPRTTSLTKDTGAKHNVERLFTIA